MARPRPAALFFCLAFGLPGALAQPRLVLDGPAGGTTDRPLALLDGRVEGGHVDRVLLRHEGFLRSVPVADGRFQVEVGLLAGPNRLMVVALAGAARLEREVRLEARLPPPALEAVLTWGPWADLDLAVTEPDGLRVFHGHPVRGESRFHGDVVGEGPEIYRAGRLAPGTYRIRVVQKKSADHVPVAATLRLAWLDEGRPRWRTYSLALPGPGEVEKTVKIEKKGSSFSLQLPND